MLMVLGNAVLMVYILLGVMDFNSDDGLMLIQC